jgi:hypothetical protein
LINVELILDVVEYLKSILKVGKLSFESTLHCIIATLEILSGSGECLTVDIREIHEVQTSMLDNLKYQPELSELFVQSLWKSIIARREVDLNRIFSLVRKISEVVLFLPPGSALGLMHLTRHVIEKYPTVCKMLETDHADWDMPIGSTEFSGNVAWEILLLKKSYHPAVQNYAKILSKGIENPLPSALSSIKATQLVKMYDSLKCVFNPSVKTPSMESVKKRSFARFSWHQSFESSLDQVECSAADLSALV